MRDKAAKLSFGAARLRERPRGWAKPRVDPSLDVGTKKQLPSYVSRLAGLVSAHDYGTILHSEQR